MHKNPKKGMLAGHIKNARNRKPRYSMSRQSTRYLILIEPASFGYNPETASTNGYQMDARENADAVHARALAEFRIFRDKLVEAGASVTTMRGPKGSPDALFPNWFSTHDDGTAYFYPMMAPNRRRERTDEIMGFFRKFYAVKDDMVAHEANNRALESTGSMVMDRVNRVAYIARSKRTDEALAREWCQRTGYEPVIFDTVGHNGQPVYHTDLVIWIGSDVAGVGTQTIAEGDRQRVLQSLSRTREVLELDNAQIRNFCGNSVEVRGHGDEPVLVMSETGYGMLESDQVSRLNRYYPKVLACAIPTIQTYGGGSVRCLVQELF